MAASPLFQPGLDGVVAFETEIAEPDKEGSALRYRGVDIEDLVGSRSFGHVWGLLVDSKFNPGLPPAEPFPLPVHSGDIRVDVQSAIAMLAPAWGLQQMLDIDVEQIREDLARVSVMTMAFVAQSARGLGKPMVPQREVDKAKTIVERFMIRWKGDPDPAHTKAVDAYFVSAAEHGMNASTFTARVIASTGSDLCSAITGAIGALKGPLHGGAPSKVLDMLEAIGSAENVDPWLTGALNRGDRLMGFGHRVYKAEDPRAEILRGMAAEASTPEFFELSRRTEERALAMLHERKPDHRLYTNVEFYSAAVLSAVGLPGDMFTPTFAVSRVTGWTAHVLEQIANNRLIRPQSEFVGATDKKFVVIERR